MSLTLRIDVPRRDLLSSNGRYHHYERARRAREIRTRAALIKRSQHRDGETRVRGPREASNA